MASVDAMLHEVAMAATGTKLLDAAGRLFGGAAAAAAAAHRRVAAAAEPHFPIGTCFYIAT